MVNFADLKNRKKNSLTDIRAKAEKMAGGGQKKKFEKDPRFWELTKDANGEGNAVIRFLDAKDPDVDKFMVSFYKWSFKINGRWLIANAPHTLGLPDPIYEYRGALYAADEDSVEARLYKRGARNIANILVVRDAGNPDNNGKVFLYEFGKDIKNRLNSLMTPPEEDVDPVDPFNFWEGKNLRLRLKKPETPKGNSDEKVIANYDTSEFADKSAIGTDEYIAEILDKLYDLSEFEKPEYFPSYVELQNRFFKIIGREDLLEARTSGIASSNGRDYKSAPEPTERDSPITNGDYDYKNIPSSDEDESAPWKDADEDDDELAAFRSLAGK